MAKFDLLTTLTLNAAGFTQGIDRAKTSTQGFQKTISSAAGGLLKFLGPIGLGVGVLDTLKKGIESTDGSMDKLEETTGLLQGGFQGFFETVFSADWSNLISNINNTAIATKNLVRAKDELAMGQASNSIKIGFYQQELSAAKLGAAETTDPNMKAQYIRDAIDAQRAITSIEIENVASRSKIVEDYFQTKKGWTDEERNYNIESVRKIAGSYKYYFGENSIVVDGLNERIKTLNYLKLSTVGGLSDAQEKELRQTKLLIGSLDIFKQLMDGMKPDAFKEYVSSIGEFNSAVAQGDQDLVKLQKSLTSTETKISKLSTTAKFKKLDLIPKAAIDNLKIPVLTIDVDEVKLAEPPKMPNLSTEWLRLYGIELQSVIENVSNMINDELQNMLAGFFEAIGENLVDNKTWNFGETVLLGLSTFMSQLGKILIGLGTAKIALDKLFSNPETAILAGAGLLILAGVIKATVQKQSSTFGTTVQNMASGGIAYGESLVNVGEYGNAKSNPEIIAPLDKLKDLLGGGAVGGEVLIKFQNGSLEGYLNYNKRRVNSFA